MIETKTDGVYDLYRCRKCNSVITKLQVLAVFARKADTACPCGGNSFNPTNLLAHEWFFPRVWKLALYRLMGWIAPPPAEDLPPPNFKFQEVPPLKKL